MLDGSSMSSTAFILSGLASIPRLLTMKHKNFSADTPKAHLAWIQLHVVLSQNLERLRQMSSVVVDFTNMSSMYTSMDVPICFWNILFTSL